jgi:hypothetical protein
MGSHNHASANDVHAEGYDVILRIEQTSRRFSSDSTAQLVTRAAASAYMNSFFVKPVELTVEEKKEDDKNKICCAIARGKTANPAKIEDILANTLVGLDGADVKVEIYGYNGHPNKEFIADKVNFSVSYQPNPKSF